MKKFWIIILIIILINIVGWLSGILIRAIIGGENWFMSFGKVERLPENVRKEMSVSIDGVENLNLNFKSSEARVIVTDSDEIKIIEYSKKKLDEKDLFTLENTKESININEGKSKFHLFSFNNIAYDIYIPQKYENNLKIFTGSGDVEFSEEMNLKDVDILLISGDCMISSKIVSEEIIIKSTSGDIKVNSLETKKLDMSSTSGEVVANGDIISENVQLKSVSGDVISGKVESKNVDIETTSGDIKVSEIMMGRVNAKSVSGDIKIEKISGNADLKTTSGDINVSKFEILGDSNINSTSGDVKITPSQNSNCNIDTNTTSGDVGVSNSNIGDGEFKLKIKTTSGDIKVY